jgi:hypothetical protein
MGAKSGIDNIHAHRPSFPVVEQKEIRGLQTIDEATALISNADRNSNERYGCTNCWWLLATQIDGKQRGRK